MNPSQARVMFWDVSREVKLPVVPTLAAAKRGGIIRKLYTENEGIASLCHGVAAFIYVANGSGGSVDINPLKDLFIHCINDDNWLNKSIQSSRKKAIAYLNEQHQLIHEKLSSNKKDILSAKCYANCLMSAISTQDASVIEKFITSSHQQLDNNIIRNIELFATIYHVNINKSHLKDYQINKPVKVEFETLTKNNLYNCIIEIDKLSNPVKENESLKQSAVKINVRVNIPDNPFVAKNETEYTKIIENCIKSGKGGRNSIRYLLKHIIHLNSFINLAKTT